MSGPSARRRAVALCLLGASIAGAFATARPPSSPAEAPVTASFELLAGHALLVPLLDDDDPPRWTDVGYQLFCGPATWVEVDGQALAPGERLPARAFVLRWHMDRCFPLDFAAFELSGTAELLVFPDDGALSASVDARQLRVATARGAGRIGHRFAASVDLGQMHAPGRRRAP